MLGGKICCHSRFSSTWEMQFWKRNLSLSIALPAENITTSHLVFSSFSSSSVFWHLAEEVIWSPWQKLPGFQCHAGRWVLQQHLLKNVMFFRRKYEAPEICRNFSLVTASWELSDLCYCKCCCDSSKWKAGWNFLTLMLWSAHFQKENQKVVINSGSVCLGLLVLFFWCYFTTLDTKERSPSCQWSDIV